VLALAAALPGVAQQPPEQQDVLTQWQSKSALTDEDQAALRAWVAERVQAIAATDPAASTSTFRELRRAHRGTEAFKQAFAGAVAEAVRSAYGQAKRDSAAQLIALLNTLDEVSSYNLLIEVLGDKRVPVRTAAVIGLVRLREEIAGAGSDAFSQTIAALREAGKRETSAVTLKLIYRALDYTAGGSSPPDPKACATAVLEILEARSRQYEARDVKAAGADRRGLELVSKLLGQLDGPARQRLAIATAKMLHYAVERYTSELHKVRDKSSSPVQIALRNRMELFIAAAEQLLVQLTSPEDPPNVTKQMQEQPVGDKVTEMKIAWGKWADLLQQRYQIDVSIALTEEEPSGEAETDETEETGEP
jgi:hypothetical protein